MAARVEPRRVDSLSLVRFDANDYSVPTAYAHHRVTVVAHGRRRPHRRRRPRRGDPPPPLGPRAGRPTTRCTTWPCWSASPGRWTSRRPLEGWELPVCFGVLRRRLEAEFGGPGTRQFIKVLRLLERASLGELTRAVERALELGVADADAVRLILEHRRERPVGLFCLDGRPHLKLVAVPAPDLRGLREPGGGGGVMKKLETKSTVLLKHHLKALKLPTMTAECEKVAAAVRAGERRPPGLPAPAVRAGAARARAPGGRSGG